MSSGPFRPAHQVLAVFLASLCFLSEIKCMYVMYVCMYDRIDQSRTSMATVTDDRMVTFLQQRSLFL